jgi:hypothetical protein
VVKINRGEIWGNVLLKSEESGLPKDSVVNVSQIATLTKTGLKAKQTEGNTMQIAEKKLKILEEIGAGDVIERTLDKLVSIQISRYQMAIQQITPDLKAFERQFEMSSEECYSRFNSGEMGDDGDIFEWVSLYENVLLYQKRLNLLGVSAS